MYVWNYVSKCCSNPRIGSITREGKNRAGIGMQFSGRKVLCENINHDSKMECWIPISVEKQLVVPDSRQRGDRTPPPKLCFPWVLSTQTPVSSQNTTDLLRSVTGHQKSYKLALALLPQSQRQPPPRKHERGKRLGSLSYLHCKLCVSSLTQLALLPWWFPLHNSWHGTELHKHLKNCRGCANRRAMNIGVETQLWPPRIYSVIMKKN